MLLLATALNDWDWNFPSPGAPDPSMTQTSRVSPSSFSLIPSFPTSDYLVNDSSVAVKIVWFLPLWFYRFSCWDCNFTPLLELEHLNISPPCSGTSCSSRNYTGLLEHHLLLLQVGLSAVSLQHLLAAMVYMVSLVVFLWLLLLRYGVTVVPDY
uniref:Uncharacterized protein n=1 Tax=Oryza barthii TaxID=65489 RepID=A0A0D3FKA6_9ORYZ